MHYHLEIIMPPVDQSEIEEAIGQILAPFSENADDDTRSRGAFFDWYVIGGSWAGEKQKAAYDSNKLDEFYAWLQEEKVTVSALIAGKRSINPESQIPKIDAKWNEMFPSKDGLKKPCPLFSHASNQYAEGLAGTLDGDICTLSEIPEGLTCARVIIAGRGYNGESGDYSGPFRAVHMLSDDFWNGVNYQKCAWDGKVLSALTEYIEKLSGYREEYRETHTPKDDWLVVTVDYHN